MKKSKYGKIKQGVQYLKYILTQRQRMQAVGVLVLSCIGSILEMLGVSVILPLMDAMVQPEQLLKKKWARLFCSLFNISGTRELIIAIGLGVSLIYIAKNIYFVFLSWVRARYSSRIQKEMATKTFDSFIRHGYDFFLLNNSSDLMRRINVDIPSIHAIIQCILRLFSELTSVLLISVYIAFTDITMALMVVGLGLLCAVFIVILNHSKIKRYGVTARDQDKKLNNIMMQTFQGIKEVLVMNRQDYFEKRYVNEYEKYNNVVVGRTVLEESPIYVIEGICVSGFLGAVSIRAALSSNINSFIPLMATFAIGAFRILPSMGKISGDMNSALYYIPSLKATYDNLKMLEKDDERDKRIIQKDNENALAKVVSFNKGVSISGLYWRYEGQKELVLDNLSLSIKKGESIGIIGKSGAGKSTLVDILLGLHIPQSGNIYVDDISIFSIPHGWSRMIGYVPQSIYLADNTIRNNVAFGVADSEIDDAMVWKCLDEAMLADSVRKLPEGLDTLIGERGARISGGQRQRMAIARALYHQPQILIMDEATSALDNETEKAVMDAIESLQGTITMVIVAHRLTTVRKCNLIYEIQDGKALEVEKDNLF